MVVFFKRGLRFITLGYLVSLSLPAFAGTEDLKAYLTRQAENIRAAMPATDSDNKSAIGATEKDAALELVWELPRLNKILSEEFEEGQHIDVDGNVCDVSPSGWFDTKWVKELGAKAVEKTGYVARQPVEYVEIKEFSGLVDLKSSINTSLKDRGFDNADPALQGILFVYCVISEKEADLARVKKWAYRIWHRNDASTEAIFAPALKTKILLSLGLEVSINSEAEYLPSFFRGLSFSTAQDLINKVGDSNPLKALLLFLDKEAKVTTSCVTPSANIVAPREEDQTQQPRDEAIDQSISPLPVGADSTPKSKMTKSQKRRAAAQKRSLENLNPTTAAPVESLLANAQSAIEDVE